MLRFALVTVLVGCASNDQIPPSSLEYDDLALSVGSTVAMPGGGELGAVGDVVTLAHGALPAGFTASADGTVSGTHAGLGYSYRVVCKDAQGAAVPCDATTDAIDADVSWTGSLDLPDTGMAFQRTGPWVLSGMTQGIALANGTATLDYTSRVANPDRGNVSTYHLAYTATYDDVAYDTVAMKVLGGDIHYALAVDRTVTGANAGDDHFAVAATTSFAGDGTATIDLDGAHQYELMLATATVVRI